MFIKELNLINYRNYDNLKIKFTNKINIIYGDNGQGKTNILESVYFLSNLKSHRINNDNDLIKNDKKASKIKGKIKRNDILYNHEIELRDTKIVKIDKTNIIKNSDYMSTVNVVMFNPDDLEIIKGSPENRRKYIDNSIYQLNKSYYKLINEYNKLLKMRNDYLKNTRYIDDNYYEILTSYLIEKSVDIYLIRNKYVIKLNNLIENIYNELTSLEKFQIKYIPSIEIDNFNRQNIKYLLEKEYEKVKNNELKFKKTLFGPQKDEFIFYLQEKDLKKYGSQGQQRMAIISTKLAEMEIINKIKGEYPILLLDDVLSELDIKKRNKLLKYIDKCNQTIITTTDIAKINKKVIEQATLFKIKEGKII